MPNVKKWTRGAPFLYDLAMAVRAGYQMIDDIAERFPQVKKDTVTKALRQLSDEGYLRVETEGRVGGGRYNVYTVRIMPPEPEPEIVQSPHHQPTVTALDFAWRMPVPLPKGRVKYVKRPVGPI